MPGHSDATQEAPPAHDRLTAWVIACLADDLRVPTCALPKDSAVAEGLLPWLAWCLQNSGALTSLPDDQQPDLLHALRRWNLMHLDCEAELERLSRSATDRGVRFLVFKGHSVARTLYQHPACRPTSDFDVLTDPRQIEDVKKWLASVDYAATDPFAGTIWLGAQNWARKIEGKVRFHVDAHWDYTSRMYFRRCLSFEEIWAESQEVPCGGASLRLPCKVDNLVFACVHLAAFDPGWKVKLVWLLDIYLLMDALDEAEIPVLLKRAGKARAIEACLVFGERAAELGDREKLRPVLEALRGRASEKRWEFYQRTLRNRGVDLGAYWVRLSLSDKVGFFGDAFRWVKVRNRG